MGFTIGNAGTTQTTRSDLPTVLSDPERVLDQATVDVGLKTPSFETVGPELAVMTNKKTAPSFVERVMSVHTITMDSKYMAGNVVESDYDAPSYKPKPSLKTLDKLLCGMRSEIELALADLGVVTKADVEIIVANRLTKWSNMVHSQIVDHQGRRVPT